MTDVAELRARSLTLIDRLAEGGRDDEARDALLADIAAWQRKHIRVVAAIAKARPNNGAVPTDVFRTNRVAAHPPSQDVQTFVSSGTTASDRSTHALSDMTLYDRAAYAGARFALLPDIDAIRLVIIAPSPTEAPNSSLSYMLGRFADWFATDVTWAWRDDAIEGQALCKSLEAAVDAAEPVLIAGTSFGLVHAERVLGPRRFQLPPASRIMQTGGFKGRSETVEPEAMHAMLRSRYGVAHDLIISEYGMTELSSQLYGTRRYWIPGWVRVTAINPDTLQPLPTGEVGVLRIDDCANVDSSCAILTADLGRLVDEELELIGRAPSAVARGCSISADALLQRSP